jgi:hypothetical protein
MSEYDAEAWPLDAAASSLAQVIDGFSHGDIRPLVIGDGDQPVLVVLSIADLADFRARISHLLSNPVDAGWLRYYLRSNFDMSVETLVELLGVDTDHGLTSLLSQVTIEQAANLLPDHLRRAEEGANPLMLIGDGRLASAALVSFRAFDVMLAMEGGGEVSHEHGPDGVEEQPTMPLETLAAQIGPVTTQIVAQLNAAEGPEVIYGLHFEESLVEHLRDLERRAQEHPGGGAHQELQEVLASLDEMRRGLADDNAEPVEAPYVEAVDLRRALPEIRDAFREGADGPYLVGIEGRALAGLVTFDLYELLQQASVDLNGTENAPVLPLPAPAWEGGPPVQPFELALEVANAVVDDIDAGEGSLLFIGDEDGSPELVLAPLAWLWEYVDHLDVESVEAS